MKKILTVAITIICVGLMNTANAQNYTMYDYEGIARAKNGAPVANKTVTMLVTVKNHTAKNGVAYEEIQTVHTNSHGRFHTVIGAGDPVNGSMDMETWGENTRFVKIELASAAENSGEVMGVTCVRCRNADQAMVQNVGMAARAKKNAAPAESLTTEGYVAK